MKSVKKKIQFQVGEKAKTQAWNQTWLHFKVWDKVWDIVRLQTMSQINYKVMDPIRLQVYREIS